MDYSLLFRTDASVICVILFLACIQMVIVGKFIRNKFFYSDQQKSKGGVTSLLGALFGLWAFVLKRGFLFIVRLPALVFHGIFAIRFLHNYQPSVKDYAGSCIKN